MKLQVNPQKQLKLFYLLQTALGLHYIALQKLFKIREAIFNLPGQIIGYAMERKHAQKAHPMHDGYRKPDQTNNLIVNKRPALRPNSGTETIGIIARCHTLQSSLAHMEILTILISNLQVEH